MADDGSRVDAGTGPNSPGCSINSEKTTYFAK
jgi:hypothetical protein